jgi:hypothetical protein
MKIINQAPASNLGRRIDYRNSDIFFIFLSPFKDVLGEITVGSLDMFPKSFRWTLSSSECFNLKYDVSEVCPASVFK